MTCYTFANRITDRSCQSDAERHHHSRTARAADRISQLLAFSRRTALACRSDSDDSRRPCKAEPVSDRPNYFSRYQRRSHRGTRTVLVWLALRTALFRAALQAIFFAGFLRSPDRRSVCKGRLLVLAVLEIYPWTYAYHGSDGWRHQDVRGRFLTA